MSTLLCVCLIARNLRIQAVGSLGLDLCVKSFHLRVLENLECVLLMREPLRKRVLGARPWMGITSQIIPRDTQADDNACWTIMLWLRSVIGENNSCACFKI